MVFLNKLEKFTVWNDPWLELKFAFTCKLEISVSHIQLDIVPLSEKEFNPAKSIFQYGVIEIYIHHQLTVSTGYLSLLHLLDSILFFSFPLSVFLLFLLWFHEGLHDQILSNLCTQINQYKFSEEHEVFYVAIANYDALTFYTSQIIKLIHTLIILFLWIRNPIRRP